MRSNFIPEDRRLLELCSRAARFCGQLLLGIGVLIGVLVLARVPGLEVSGVADASRSSALIVLPTILFMGFAALLLSEFITYLLAEQGEPKWILRQGDKIIYAYVLYFTVVSVIGVVFPRVVNQELEIMVSVRAGLLGVALTLALIIARMLIWIGIAIVLRKVVPIIRESKTLV